MQVELARVEDFGRNDKTFFVKTHLGEVLNYNDHVLGYDLEKINLTEIEDFSTNNTRQRALPDVVVVRKTFPRVRKRQKQRIWKLKHFDNVEEDEEETGGKKRRGNDAEKKNRDYETFLKDLDEDPEMRGQISLFKDDDVLNSLEAKLASMNLNEKSPEEE